MKIIMDRKRSFDLGEFLGKPLFAHLSTICDDGPRDSPVWFHWESEHIWIIGTSIDSFPRRIQQFRKCSIGIIDFDLSTGKVLHAGFRGTAKVVLFDEDIATRLLSRYLGHNIELWDPRFKNFDNRNVLICFKPETVVVRDQSFEIQDRG